MENEQAPPWPRISPLFEVLQVGVNVQCSTSREGDVLALFTGFGAGHFILCSFSFAFCVWVLNGMAMSERDREMTLIGLARKGRAEEGGGASETARKREILALSIDGGIN